MRFTTTFRRLFAVNFLLICVLPFQAVAGANNSGINVESYRPGIWVDPDGCEHWVMDDGFEGYMSPHVTPDGKPVCRKKNICAVLPTDTLFPTDSNRVSQGNRQRLMDFFTKAQEQVVGVIISGHTDSRASHAYNNKLSQRRADAVADIAESANMPVYSANGYGETIPVASNNTAAGMAKNRRVEILCLY